MRNSLEAVAWVLVVGWVGLLLLPWYGVEGVSGPLLG